MAAVNKIDSNVVGLRVAEEETIGVLPTTPVWEIKEPNGFSDFGATLNTIARNPINPSRQRKKGVVVGLDAVAGYSSDLTQSNLQSDLQGFLFADLRTKSELPVAVTTVSAFQPASGGDGYVAGDILAAKNFADTANNGPFTVTGTPTATEVSISGTLVASTAQSGVISKVGFSFADGDADIDMTGTLPAIVTTTKDLTELGLIVGEWVYIGGDAAGSSYAGSTNNGFARVRSVAANRMEFDKTDATMVTEDSTGLTISIYFGRVLKNEVGSLIKRRTYQLEQTLGAPDDANLNQLQAKYMIGSVANELKINIASEDKVTFDISYVCTDEESRTAAQGLKAGTRPNLVESDAFNTSSDCSRIKLSKVVDGDAAPTPLYAFAKSLDITITNSASPNKAVCVLGSFDVSVATFDVSASITAYLADLVATQAVRNNDDVTLDVHFAKQNSGISFDMPLLSLGDGKANIQPNEPIELPLTADAATGAKIDSQLDHTILFVFWDYLPTNAEA